MMDVKQQVREFYNRVGWKEIGEGIYQNARYEDLRPVSQEYIHRCHMRLLRHLKPAGRFLLDAGSGPIQYPEYLEYSRHYQRRVCVDISLVALQEARKRIGDHGLFVVADVANLPFKADSFDGMVSLHTLHHLPLEEQVQAYEELYRSLAPGSTGVVVNGWDTSFLDAVQKVMVRGAECLYRMKRRLDGHSSSAGQADKQWEAGGFGAHSPNPKGTFVRKHNASWLKTNVGDHISLRIWVWRSVSVHFLRTFIHGAWGGRSLLRLLFWMEERFPHLLGKNGKYPLIVIQKPGR